MRLVIRMGQWPTWPTGIAAMEDEDPMAEGTRDETLGRVRPFQGPRRANSIRGWTGRARRGGLEGAAK